jgi:hypothetical protein
MNDTARIRYRPAGRFFLLAAVMLMTALLAGCAATYGRFQDDPGVTSQFVSGTPPSGFTYYWYGNSNNYYAIAGLDPKFVVRSFVWRRISPGSEEFKKAVFWIWEDYGFRQYGAHILDPSGARVGVWFSSLRYPTVKFNGPQEIELIPDMPFLWGPGASTGSGGKGPGG